LIAIEVHEAHILRLHETFAHQRGRADRDVLTGTNGDVSAVAVHVFTLPQATTDVAKLQLQTLRVG